VSLLVGRFGSPTVAAELLPKYWKILELQNLRSVRVYIEASFAFLLLQSPDAIDDKLIG